MKRNSLSVQKAREGNWSFAPSKGRLSGTKEKRREEEQKKKKSETRAEERWLLGLWKNEASQKLPCSPSSSSSPRRSAFFSSLRAFLSSSATALPTAENKKRKERRASPLPLAQSTETHVRLPTDVGEWLEIECSTERPHPQTNLPRSDCLDHSTQRKKTDR